MSCGLVVMVICCYTSVFYIIASCSVGVHSHFAGGITSSLVAGETIMEIGNKVSFPCSFIGAYLIQKDFQRTFGGSKPLAVFLIHVV